MRLKSEDKAGLYITVIIHLTVIIILLVCQISNSLSREDKFLLDFSRQDEIEKKKEEERRKKELEDFDKSIERKLDQLIRGEARLKVRNIAVDLSGLKDDRNTDSKQLYKDAEDLEKKLKEGVKNQENIDDNYVDVPKPKQKEKTKTYNGPSVVSYLLEGRKAYRLPIPAYRCLGGGIVTVLITVNPNGKVIGAKIQEESSSEDRCLREFAIKAALMSKFSPSSTAPKKQGGNIVYQFIAQ